MSAGHAAGWCHFCLWSDTQFACITVAARDSREVTAGFAWLVACWLAREDVMRVHVAGEGRVTGDADLGPARPGAAVALRCPVRPRTSTDGWREREEWNQS